MTGYDIKKLLDGFHQSLVNELNLGKDTGVHPVSKGDASEAAWIKLLNNHLPERYQADSGFVIDSEGNISDQIDLIIFDRQYSPFIFKIDTVQYIPAESVYAVFEIKPSLNKKYLTYAQDKAKSVRELKRTSIPIQNVYGEAPAKALPFIHAGLLCLTSEWNPPFGQPFEKVMTDGDDSSQINLVCIANDGFFEQDDGSQISKITDKASTHFFFRLLSILQKKGTVPQLDIMAYTQWLDEEPKKEETK